MNDPLSAEDAIAALSGLDEEGAPAAEEDEISGEEAGEEDYEEEIDASDEVQADADDDGDDPDGDHDADEDEEGDEPDEPAIEPPQFLDEKMRAQWAALPREAQEMVLAHDKALVADYTRKTQAVAEERKQVSAQRQQLDRILSSYDEVLPEAERKAREWQDVDWVKLKANTTADEYLQFQAQAQADFRAAAQLREQRAKAELDALKTHVETESAALREIAQSQNAADLIHPEKAKEETAALLEYVRKCGYSDDEIKWIGAQDMVIAWKAMQYDRMIARRGNKTPALNPKPDAKTAAKPVRAGARASSSKRAAKKGVVEQFRKTGDRNLAMQLLSDID